MMCFQGFWVAAEVCSFLWKSSGSFNPIIATLSISLGLDYNWHLVVHECKKLCKCHIFLLFGLFHLPTVLILETMLFNACSCQKRVRNGVSSFGCFSATVDFFVSLACVWERLVTLPALCVYDFHDTQL